MSESKAMIETICASAKALAESKCVPWVEPHQSGCGDAWQAEWGDDDAYLEIECIPLRHGELRAPHCMHGAGPPVHYLRNVDGIETEGECSHEDAVEMVVSYMFAVRGRHLAGVLEWTS